MGETKKMSRKWLDFEGAPNRSSADKLRVTLNNKGVILLNDKAYQALDTPAAVTLHYDEYERIIGLKPVDARHRNSFPLRHKEKKRYRIIYASPFCRHFRIKVDRTVLFNDVDLDNDGIMTLSLRTATTISRGRY